MKDLKDKAKQLSAGLVESNLKTWLHNGTIWGLIKPNGHRGHEEGLTHVVALTQTAVELLPENNAVRDQITDICRRIITANVKLDEDLPWSKVRGEDSDFSRFYNTGRVVFDLGKTLTSIADTNIIKKAKKGLEDQIKSCISEDSWKYLPLIYRAAVGLKKINKLDRKINGLVSDYATRCIHRFCSLYTINGKSELDPILLCVALAMDAYCSNRPLSQRERSNCFKIICSEYSLMDSSVGTILRGRGDWCGCSSFEPLNELLQISYFWDIMNENTSCLYGTLDWLEEHSEIKYGSNQRDFTRLFQSDIFAEKGAYDAWFNALALRYLNSLIDFCHHQEQRYVKHNFRDRGKPKPVSNIICGGFSWPTIVQDFLSKVAESKRPTKETGNGILLFGPPGTGKTTLAEHFTAQLSGWDFIQITTADFLTEGIDGLFKRINEIFGWLSVLEKCVVFFDEMDSFLLERPYAKPFGELRNTLLTNTMLTEIANLHDSYSVIPIFATNHIHVYDTAIVRHSRLDLRLPVGYPNTTERQRLIQEKMPSALYENTMPEYTKNGAVSEILQWVRECVDINKKGKEREIWNNKYAGGVESRKKDIEQFKEDILKYSFPLITTVPHD